MNGFSWPTYDQVVAVHDASIDRFGGMPGLRDEGLLSSALARPFAAFAGVEVYPDDISKLCAMVHSLIANHPFADGNKRVGAAVLGMTLRANGCRFKPRHDELCSVILGVAAGEVSLHELTDWVRQQTA